MTGQEFEVGEYADLRDAGLTGRGRERVLEELKESPAVVWLEDWIREEKALTPLEGTQGLYAVQVKASSDKAWCLAQEEGQEEWVPRSQAELYRRAEDGLAGPSEQQASLRDWSER